MVFDPTHQSSLFCTNFPPTDETLTPLEPGAANPLAKVKAELVEVRLDAALSEGTEMLLKVRGTEVRYDAKKQELTIAGHKAPVHLRDGKLSLIVLADRTSLTLWTGDGLTYVPMPIIPKAADRSLLLSVTKGSAKVTSLHVHEMMSIWATRK